MRSVIQKNLFFLQENLDIANDLPFLLSKGVISRRQYLEATAQLRERGAINGSVVVLQAMLSDNTSEKTRQLFFAEISLPSSEKDRLLAPLVSSDQV